MSIADTIRNLRAKKGQDKTPRYVELVKREVLTPAESEELEVVTAELHIDPEIADYHNKAAASERLSVEQLASFKQMKADRSPFDAAVAETNARTVERLAGYIVHFTDPEMMLAQLVKLDDFDTSDIRQLVNRPDNPMKIDEGIRRTELEIKTTRAENPMIFPGHHHPAVLVRNSVNIPTGAAAKAGV